MDTRGSLAGIATRLPAVGVRGTTSRPSDRAALAVATAHGPRDATDDEEGAEPINARRSGTRLSISVATVRILGAGHLRRARLRRGGLVAT